MRIRVDDMRIMRLSGRTQGVDRMNATTWEALNKARRSRYARRNRGQLAQWVGMACIAIACMPVAVLLGLALGFAS